MSFRWHPNESPPSLEDHSKAKLTVLRSYLSAYFDRLGRHLARDQFKLDLIDGFAGGGTLFRDGDKTVSGTPLIMLEESEAAKARLSRHRTKRLLFDFKHYFVDIETAHTDHLKKVLDERGYQVDGEKIVIRNSRFEDSVDAIIFVLTVMGCPAGSTLRSTAVNQEPGARFFFWTNVGYSQVSCELLLPGFSENCLRPKLS